MQKVNNKKTKKLDTNRSICIKFFYYLISILSKVILLISSIWKDEFFTNFEYPVFIISFVNPKTCAYDKYLKGEYGDSSNISPLYLRKSQAERAMLEQ